MKSSIDKMDFQQSLDYLYSLGNEVLAMKLGLESTEKLLGELGNPQKNFLKIQIAGTNGKGSSCAFLESICRSAGIRTGLTTSPHLISITERIKIDGAPITEEKFAAHAAAVRNVSEKLVARGELEQVPTFFEQVTAIAISAFAEARVKLAILETGLGGRFDSVTAARAEIVAITPIDYDHQQILGNTLAEIAAEKAAIIREDTRVIVAPQKKEAERVILGRCRELGVQPIFSTPNYRITKEKLRDSSFLLDASFKTEKNYYPNVLLNLRGRHQFENAATAIAIAEVLPEFEFEVSQEAIISGLESAEHRGRLEFYGNILFDGAHNIGGAKALRAFLDEFIKQPVTMVFGAMRDKDLTEIAGILFSKAENLIFTKPDNPRAMETAELLEFLPENFDDKKVFLAPSVAEALDLASQISGENHLICVTGSLYLVGEAQEILAKASNENL